MPFDGTKSQQPKAGRPYMRCMTAELSTMADAAQAAADGATLAAIAAELEHRDRKPARELLSRIRALLAPEAAAERCDRKRAARAADVGPEVAASVAAKVAAMEAAPAAIIVPCERGELIGPRDEVVAVERGEAAEDVQSSPLDPRPGRPWRWVVGERDNLRGEGAAKLRRRLEGWRANVAMAEDAAGLAIAAIHAAVTRAALARIPGRSSKPRAPRKGKAVAAPAAAPLPHVHLGASAPWARAYLEATRAAIADGDGTLAAWFNRTVWVRCAKLDKDFGMSPRVNNGKVSYVRTFAIRRVPAPAYWPDAWADKMAKAQLPRGFDQPERESLMDDGGAWRAPDAKGEAQGTGAIRALFQLARDSEGDQADYYRREAERMLRNKEETARKLIGDKLRAARRTILDHRGFPVSWHRPAAEADRKAMVREAWEIRGRMVADRAKVGRI